MFVLENDLFYCVEFLVGSILCVVECGEVNFSFEWLYEVVEIELVFEFVCEVVGECYDEGYECGVYDVDVVFLLM